MLQTERVKLDLLTISDSLIYIHAYEKFGVFFNSFVGIFLPSSKREGRDISHLPVRAWRHIGVCNWHQKSRG